MTITWKVDARDDDDLMYDVRVRPEGGGEDEWIGLGPKDELVTKKELKWDISSVPDGVYEIGVTASDEPSNGSTRARTDAIVSAPFVVDRQRPAIGKPTLSGDRIKGTASRCRRLRARRLFAIDGGPMRAASPTDGLFDSADEGFEVVIPSELGKGKHRIVLRVRDSFGNASNVAVGDLALVPDRLRADAAHVVPVAEHVEAAHAVGARIGVAVEHTDVVGGRALTDRVRGAVLGTGQSSAVSHGRVQKFGVP